MTAFGQRVLDFAASQLGVSEQPHGSNRGPVVDEYLRAVGLDPEGHAYPWCAAFCCWSIQQASMGWAESVSWSPSAGCAMLVRRNAALLIEEPMVGCVFVHLGDGGKGHCGFVTGIRPDGSLETLEGNSDASGSRTGGQVVRQHRQREYAHHFLRVGHVGPEDSTPRPVVAA